MVVTVATGAGTDTLLLCLQAWGHSTVVGPFAEVLATTGHEPTIVYADIDYAEVSGGLRLVRWKDFQPSRCRAGLGRMQGDCFAVKLLRSLILHLAYPNRFYTGLP